MKHEVLTNFFWQNILFLSIGALAVIAVFVCFLIIYYIRNDKTSRSYHKSYDIMESMERTKRYAKHISNIADNMLYQAMVFIEDGDNIVLSVEDVKENFDHMKMLIENHHTLRYNQRLPFKFLWCQNAFQAIKMIPEILKRGAKLKAAVCDMDLGVSGGNVNDVIKELAARNTPTIIYTGYSKEEFESKILPELKSKVIYQHKGQNKEMSDILDHIIHDKLEIIK